MSDLLLDPLTFTICTGNEDDRKLALWTLEAIEDIRREFPELQLILGLSNVSFGLNPAARHVLNSVMLDHAMRRGLTGAIVHCSKIVPLHKIPPEEVEAAEDLIFDRRRDGHDPLQAFMALFADRKAAAGVAKVRPETIEEQLKLRIVDGDKQGLEADLDTALERYAPLAIINDILLDGMKTVGELFGAGKMQLPVRAAVGRDDEEGRGLSRAPDGAGRGPGEGHDRPRHRQGRRARHRQEPGRHHPDQQRLPRGQSRHQAAADRDPRRGAPSTRPTPSACPASWSSRP